MCKKRTVPFRPFETLHRPTASHGSFSVVVIVVEIRHIYVYLGTWKTKMVTIIY